MQETSKIHTSNLVWILHQITPYVYIFSFLIFIIKYIPKIEIDGSKLFLKALKPCSKIQKAHAFVLKILERPQRNKAKC